MAEQQHRPVRRARAWARAAPSASRPRSPTRSTMRSACGSPSLPLNPEAVFGTHAATAMRREIQFTLNGRGVSAQVAPAREPGRGAARGFGLYGARESCGQGMCGCCTVLVDGTRGFRLPYLAALADGAEVETIEGGRRARRRAAGVHRVRGAFQCGFCTPGFILMTRQLLDEHPDPDDDADPALPVGQPVPLRGLSGNHRGGEARR